jgi:hypothetical protein
MEESSESVSLENGANDINKSLVRGDRIWYTQEKIHDIVQITIF